VLRRPIAYSGMLSRALTVVKYTVNLVAPRLDPQRDGYDDCKRRAARRTSRPAGRLVHLADTHREGRTSCGLRALAAPLRGVWVVRAEVRSGPREDAVEQLLAVGMRQHIGDRTTPQDRSGSL
jgi:hypothetical protein